MWYHQKGRKKIIKFVLRMQTFNLILAAGIVAWLSQIYIRGVAATNQHGNWNLTGSESLCATC